jgi:hypothetical protein
VASFGAGGLMGGVGGGIGGGAAGLAAQSPGLRMLDRDPAGRMGPAAPGRERMENGARAAPMTPEEEARVRQAAEDAAKAAAAASWTLLGSLLIALAATMLSAGLFSKKVETRRPETRMRPQPALTS